MDKIVAGDTEPPYTAILFDGAARFDPSSATEVRLKAWQDDALVINAVMASDDTGVCTYAWSSLETANPGPMKSRIVCTFPGGKKQTFPPAGYLLTTISPAAPGPTE